MSLLTVGLCDIVQGEKKRLCILADDMLEPDPIVLKKIATFFHDFSTSVYKKGEMILRAEDLPYGAYYLIDGYVRQYLLSPSGETFIVHVYKPGSFFPLPWIVNNTPNIFYFEALKKAEIARAPKEQFVLFLKKNSDVLFYTVQKLAMGMSGIVSRIGQLVLDDAYVKTVLLLLYQAEVFGRMTKQGMMLDLPITHREIAAWIGTTRETASLQIEKLQKKGIITTRGRQLVIRDLQKLQHEARVD